MNRTLHASVTILILMLLQVQSIYLPKANPTISLDPGSTPNLTINPPIISVHNPKNNTLYNTDFVVLAFNVTIPELNLSAANPKWWASYAADWIQGVGDENTILIDLQSSQTFKEFSINLTNIPEGNHSVIVYATSWIESGHYSNSQTGRTLINFGIDLTPPRISSLSIENKTYNSSQLPLTFNVDEKVSQISYRLDNKADVVIDGNTTLVGLTAGHHDLTICGTDAAGNLGSSEQISFYVNTPFPANLVEASVIVSLIAVAGLLIFFKKRKH